MATSPEYAATLAYAFNQGKNKWSPSSSDGSDASVDQASPPIFYYPPSNNTYFAPPAPLYPTFQSYPFLQDNFASPYPPTFAQPQTQFLLPPAYIQPNQHCAAPSLLFGPPETSKTAIPIPVCASPAPSSGSALAHTPTSDPVVPPPLQIRTTLLEETRGYNEKASFMPLLAPDEALREKPLSEGRKRSRTAQACEKCRIRKARVSCRYPNPYRSEACADIPPRQCFGGNPCQRCTKRRLKCEFSEATRHRASAARPEQLTPVRHVSNLKRPKITIYDAATSNNRLGLEIASSSEDQVDVDAEGEDEDIVESDDMTPWQTYDESIYRQEHDPSLAYSSPLYGIAPASSTSSSSAYGYPTPISPAYPLGLGNVGHDGSFMKYAAEVKRQAEEQLAYAACDDDVRWANYIPTYP